jgi:hypothetical protein
MVGDALHPCGDKTVLGGALCQTHESTRCRLILLGDLVAQASHLTA